MTLTARQQFSGWDDPSPIMKQLTFLASFAIVIALILVLPSLAIRSSGWFIAGTLALVGATVFAAVISREKALWRFDPIVLGVVAVSIGCFAVAIGAPHSPLEFMVVLLVVSFASYRGRRFVAYSALGAFGTLVLPVLFQPELEQRVDDVWIGVYATLALTIFSVILNASMSVHRENTEARDALLETSVEQILLLERSEAERGTAERMLRGVWEAVTEQAVAGTDLDGLIDAWNPGAQKMLGPAQSEVEHKRRVTDFHLASELDERARELGIPQGIGQADSRFAALIDSARLGKPEIREWTYVRDDGSDLPVQLSVTPRTDESGAITGYLFVANDVSEAKDAARLKDEFVGLISHELRTPLSSILGYLELMRDDDTTPLSEEHLQYLGVAERNAHRLLRLVGDLLFTAQVESGTFNLAEQDVDLAPLVSAAIESVRPVATAAGVAIEDDIADEVLVVGDPVRLGQSVDNLISNAVKFTPRGGTITISLRQAADHASIAVSDTGIGIPAAEMDKLFGRFFRATTATKQAVPGVGLGLTITKAIITAHRGRLSVESEEGAGTTFTISLPLPSSSRRPGAAESGATDGASGRG